jgi:thymidylate synthase
MTIPIYKNAKDMFDHSISLSPTNDFVGKINIFNEENAIIQTELFDIDSLRYYAKKNCGLEVTQKEKELFETEYRGGSQGDYSSEMIQKIENVVDSLVNFHNSKRAVVMMNNQWWLHDNTDEAKCLREIHFRLEEEDNNFKLCSTGFFRAQAVDIMPKNFYFVYTIMSEVLEKVKKEVKFEVKMGSYTHFVTILVPTRFD